MSTSTLREFMVRLGFRIDEGQFRRFSEVMGKTSKQAVELGKSTLAAGTVMGASLQKIGNQLENLYYAAKRTGASAAELKEFAFAASQIGVSAEQAQGAVEALAAARRANPGLNGILGGLGIDPRQTDNAKVMVQLLQKLHAMPQFQGQQIAAMFGMDAQTFTMLEAGLPQMQKYLALREKMFRAAGINPEDMTKRGHEFMVHLRTLEAALGNLADIIGYRLMPWGEKAIDWLSKMVGWLTKADKATDGWSSKLLGIAAAFAGGSILKGGLGLVGRLLGGGAAAGAAAEGGAGLLGSIALPAVVIAALGALVWLVAHPGELQQQVDQAHKLGDKMRAGVKSGLDWANDKGKAAMAELQQKPGFVGDLARMVGKFEGFRDHIYEDIAGNKTFGFGHLVKSGEDMAGVNPIALFMKDLQGSLWAVARNVKVRLTDNQRKALADLEFNIGEKKFRDSTLLRKLNAGDEAGAAAEFARWNKVLVNGHLVANATLSKRREAEAQMFRTPDSKTLNLQTTIHVEGGGDARQAARETAREQNNVYGNIVRNFTPAYQ